MVMIFLVLFTPPQVFEQSLFLLFIGSCPFLQLMKKAAYSTSVGEYVPQPFASHYLSEILRLGWYDSKRVMSRSINQKKRMWSVKTLQIVQQLKAVVNLSSWVTTMSNAHFFFTLPLDSSRTNVKTRDCYANGGKISKIDLLPYFPWACVTYVSNKNHA